MANYNEKVEVENYCRKGSDWKISSQLSMQERSLLSYLHPKQEQKLDASKPENILENFWSELPLRLSIEIFSKYINYKEVLKRSNIRNSVQRYFQQPTEQSRWPKQPKNSTENLYTVAR